MIGRAFKKILVKTKINKICFELNRLMAHSDIVDTNIDEVKLLEEIEKISPYPKGECFCDNDLKENSKYDLTIIIPSYNMGGFLEECINSVVSQNTKYKVITIVINDGSTDNTEDVLQQYKSNSSLIIINQKNKGFSESRNVALKMLESKYVMFLDADDKILPSSIDALLDCAFKNDADIVEGNHYDYINFDCAKVYKTKLQNKKVDDFCSLGGYPWAKVFKSKLFKNLHYPENFWYEDTIMSYLVFPRCKKSSYTIKNFVYAHRINAKGITLSSNRYKKSVDSYWIVKKVFENIPKYGIEVDQAIYEQTLEQLYVNYERCKRLEYNTQKKIFTLFIYLFKKHFENFNTQRGALYKKLEIAIKQCDFDMYKSICKYF